MRTGTRNLTLNPAIRQEAEKLLSILEGRMTTQELEDLSGISKYKIGFMMSVFVQSGKVKRINLNPPKYYPIAYERVSN